MNALGGSRTDCLTFLHLEYPIIDPVVEATVLGCMPFLHGLSDIKTQARSLRAKRAGLRRARFWRAQGFPNLILACAAKAAKRENGRKRERQKRNIAAGQRDASVR
jgi:hypothetical protein